MRKGLWIVGIIGLLLLVAGCSSSEKATAAGVPINTRPEIKSVGSGTVTLDVTPSQTIYGGCNNLFSKSTSRTVEAVLDNPKAIGVASVGGGGFSCNYGACCRWASFAHRCIDSKSIGHDVPDINNLPADCIKLITTGSMTCEPEGGHGLTKQTCTSSFSVSISPTVYSAKVSVSDSERKISTTNVITC